MAGKKMPKPFKRPSIDVGSFNEPREWRTVTAGEVKAMDTVVGIGLVTDVITASYDPAIDSAVEFKNALGVSFIKKGSTEVLAFVRTEA